MRSATDERQAREVHGESVRSAPPSLADAATTRGSGLPVTVLMGVYNAREHLEESICSILGQTFENFEFLIVDDGSVDGSAEIIREFAKKDERIRFIQHERNLGLGAVLRLGVEEARGELIARMDADDIAVPYRLERQVSYFSAHPETDVLGSYALDVANDGTPLRERRVPTGHDRIVNLIWSAPFIHPTVMFRKSSVLKVGSYSSTIRRRQDYDLWFRCVSGGLRLANIAEPLLHYRFSDGTVKRKHVRSMLEQVRIGLRGCRLVRAPMYAYFATCMPLVEAVMPNWIRLRISGIKSMIDPRRIGSGAERR